MKKLLFKYLCVTTIVLSGLLSSINLFAQTASFSAISGGLATSPLTAGDTRKALAGFQVAVSGGSITFVQFANIVSDFGTASLGNGTLYRSTTNNYTTGTLTPVGNVNIVSGSDISVTGLTETVTNTTNYYFLVFDIINTTGLSNANFYINTASFATSSTGSTYQLYSAYNNLTVNAGTPYRLSLYNNTTSLTTASTILTASMTNIVVLSFSIRNANTSASTTLSNLRINSTVANLSTYFTNFRIVSAATSTYPGASGSGTTPGASSFVTIPNTQAIAASTTRYFWVIADRTSGGTPTTAQFSVQAGQAQNSISTSTPASGNFNFGTAFGNTYSINSASFTITPTTSLTGLSTGTITAKQTGIVLFGFTMTKAASATTVTISDIDINSNNSNAQSYFGNGILYNCSTANYTTGTKTQAGTVVFNGAYAEVDLTGYTQNTFTAAAQTRYYFLVADNIGAPSTTETIAFNFTSGQSTAAVTQSSPAVSTYNTFSGSGNTLTLPTATLLVTGANSVATNGITASSLANGQTDAVLFGFKVEGFGTTPNFTQINISAIGVSGAPSENQVFTNGRLYRSTGSTFPTGTTPLYDNTAVSVGGGGFINCVVNETIPSGTTYYYWFVADAGGAYKFASSYYFAFVNGQSQLAFRPNPYATTFNSYAITGNTFTIGATYDWVGTTNTTYSTATNWRVNGGGVATAPGVNDHVRFGVNGYQGAANQPTITANTTIGKLTFGANNTPTLTTTGFGTTVTVTNGINTEANANVTFTGIIGAVSLGSAGVSAIGANSTLNLISGYLINDGAMTIANGGTVNITSLLGFPNNGPITATGTGALALASSLTNASNITMASGALTGTNITNSAAGSVTLASGTANFSGDLNNAGTFTGGASSLTLAGTYTNSGTFAFGTGTNDLNDATTFANTGTITLAGGTTNIAAATINNTSPGTFVATAGTINLDRTDVQTFNNSTAATPVAFHNLVLSGGNFVKTLAVTNAAAFNVNSAGSIEFTSTNTKLAAGTAILTLKSDVNGSSNVKKMLTGNAITGTVNVERYLPGGSATTRGYRLLSSPIAISSASGLISNLSYLKSQTYLSGTLGTTNGFTGTGNPSLYFYRESLTPTSASFLTGNFRGVGKINNATVSNFTIDADATTKTLPAGNGFLFFFRGGPTTVSPTTTTSIAQTATFTSLGYLNQGNVTVNHWTSTAAGTAGTAGLLYTAGSPASVRGFNLVGNPYASSIDWDTFGTGITGTNVSTTMWVYNPTAKAYTSYVANTGGIGTNTTGYADIIASGEGFFVRASSTGASLTFTESAKINVQIPVGNLRLSNDAVADKPVMQYLRIAVIKDSVNREDALIFFKNSAKPEYVEDEDAEYLKGNTIVNMSTRSADDKALAVNQTAFPKKGSTIVPLNVNVTSSGIYKLNLDEAKNIPSLYDIWLKDAFKNDSLDIKHNPTYNFNADISNSATFGSNRFTLVVRQNPGYAYHFLSFNAKKVASNVDVTWQTENEGDYTYFTVERSVDGGKTFDIIASQRATNLGNYSIVDRTPVKGENIYRLKQEDINGVVTYSAKVPVIFNNVLESILASTIAVFPNPVKGEINLQINKTADAAKYTIIITNSLGGVMKTVTGAQANWQDNVGTFLPGTYFVQVINEKDKSVVGRTSFLKL